MARHLCFDASIIKEFIKVAEDGMSDEVCRNLWSLEFEMLIVDVYARLTFTIGSLDIEDLGLTICG
jgi:hypothetical protein